MWEKVLGCGVVMGGVGEGKGRCERVKKCEGRFGRVHGVSVGKYVGVWVR